MQDTATTPEQSVWQPSLEISYSSLFGMQICLPGIQKLCNSCMKCREKGTYWVNVSGSYLLPEHCFSSCWATLFFWQDVQGMNPYLRLKIPSWWSSRWVVQILFVLLILIHTVCSLWILPSQSLWSGFSDGIRVAAFEPRVHLEQKKWPGHYKGSLIYECVCI